MNIKGVSTIIAVFVFDIAINGRSEPVQLVPTQPQAKAAFQRLGNLFSRSTTLTFSCRVSYPSSPDEKGVVDVVKGYAEKPNKFYVEHRKNGKIEVVLVSDGKTGYAFNAKQNRYHKFVPLAQYVSATIQQASEQTVVLVGADAVPILSFLTNKPDPSDNIDVPVTVTYDVSNVVTSGEKGVCIQEITQEKRQPVLLGGVFDCTVSKKTGLPLETAYGMRSLQHPKIRPTYISRYTFSQYSLDTAALPLLTFLWSPPKDASEMAASVANTHPSNR